jgi:putative transposase
VYHKDGDYAAFIKLLNQAGERTPVRLLAYVLLPNHFHLVLWPQHDGDLSDFMKWLLTAHVPRYHYHSSGHVWQGRFRAFPIQEDEHLLTVLRYIERNPVRAGLVERAENWKWSSAGAVRGPIPAGEQSREEKATPGNAQAWPVQGRRFRQSGARLVAV